MRPHNTVLITGASHGIGRATAMRFAKEGCSLVLNCMHSEDELHALRDRLHSDFRAECLACVGDVSSPDFVRQMFSEASQAFGGIDILINNAAISHVGLLQEMRDGDWRRVMGVNLDSVFYCCREAIPYMLSQKSGRILNISSVWGDAGASMEVAYSASKGGVNALTKALAKELAPSGIQVNALAFGVMDTRMNASLSPEERAALEESIPLGRYGTVEEAADAIFQLALAPDYLTGQVITMDGAWI